MRNFIQRFWLVTALITAASLMLLISDREQRGTGSGQKSHAYPKIAIMQISSTSLLDTHVAGVIDRLEERGFRAPNGSNIRLFNPQGDFGTSNAIARDMANGPYDLVITSSTIAMQTFAKANASTRKPHVFGAVTDPYGAGVGITGPEPHQHPPYMAGIGTFQPVKRAITIAREMNPGLQRIGVVWNPGEQCSEACLAEARKACAEIGIDLIEATASSTAEVSEAIRSLIARQVEAVWIGGDTVAISAIGLIINQAAQAGIPVFTNDPMDVEKGALFGLGADYFTVGQYTGDIAAAILEGRPPSSFRIENVIPEQLRFNNEVLSSLKQRWRINPSVQSLLDKTSDSPAGETSATHLEPQPAAAAGIARPAAPYKLRIVLYSETEFAERCRDGLIDGIRRAGLEEGRDFVLRTYNAQGDMSTLSSIMTSIRADNVDLLMPISTPALQAALRQAGPETKIVFTGVGDGVQAGAGRSETDHLPNVTGVTTRSPFSGMAQLIKATLPGVRRVGTLFTPAEINSVLYKDWFKEALEKVDIALVAIPVTTASEVVQAAAELCRQDIQAVAQIVDNLTRPGFALIARKAYERELPVYVFDSDKIIEGAVLALARDYYDAGLEAAEKALCVLRGENPAHIPFHNTRTERLVVNPELARRFNLRLSDELLAKATIFSPTQIQE